jgi:hypothetical protein
MQGGGPGGDVLMGGEVRPGGDVLMGGEVRPGGDVLMGGEMRPEVRGRKAATDVTLRTE